MAFLKELSSLFTRIRSSNLARTLVREIGLKSSGEEGHATFGMRVILERFSASGNTSALIDKLKSWQIYGDNQRENSFRNQTGMPSGPGEDVERSFVIARATSPTETVGAEMYSPPDGTCS